VIVPGLSARGHKILPFLQSAIEKGLSYPEWRDIARARGISYRDVVMRRDFRLLRGEIPTITRFQRVAKGRIPPERLFLKRRHYTGWKYHYRIRLTGYDIETGMPFVEFCTVGMPMRITRETAEKIAEEFLRERYPRKIVTRVMSIFGSVSR